MDRLTYLKGERSLSRKELKKYIVMFRDEIAKECEISFPSKEELNNFTSEEFDNWFMPIYDKIKEREFEDIILIELIENYICSINNVSSAEITNTGDMYY